MSVNRDREPQPKFSPAYSEKEAYYVKTTG